MDGSSKEHAGWWGRLRADGSGDDGDADADPDWVSLLI